MSSVLWPQQAQLLLILAFMVNIASVIMALAAAARGVALGDRLAMAMVAACVCLGVMVLGLYAKALGWAESNLLWILTATCTAAFFLVTTVLTIQRNRQRRLILRLSEGIAKADEITGLPVGGTLLSKISDALWRSLRIECECAVMAVWVDNLYVYNDELDSSIEHEIRRVLAARIGRAIGFRHTLGLQQGRCFVAGISSVSHREPVRDKIAKLTLNLLRPIQVGVMLGHSERYDPEIGVGVIFVGLGHMTDALNAMDQAQSLAKKALRTPSRLLVEEAQPLTEASTRSPAPVHAEKHRDR